MVKYVLMIDPSRERHDKFETELAHVDNRLRLLTAYSGKEGLQIVRQVKPSLILVNFRMMDMNVLACIKRIRALKRMPEIAIKLYDTNTGVPLLNNAQLPVTMTIFNLRDTAKDIQQFLRNSILESLNSVKENRGE